MSVRIVLVAAALLVLGCGRWRPNSAVSIRAEKPRVGYEVALHTLNRLGYRIALEDPHRGFIRAQARLNAGAYAYEAHGWTSGVARPLDNWLLIQVYRDGQILVWADGEMVRNDGKKVHRDLRREVEDIAERIHGVLVAIRDGAPVPEAEPARMLDDEPRPPPPPPPARMPPPPYSPPLNR